MADPTSPVFYPSSPDPRAESTPARADSGADAQTGQSADGGSDRAGDFEGGIDADASDEDIIRRAAEDAEYRRQLSDTGGRPRRSRFGKRTVEGAVAADGGVRSNAGESGDERDAVVRGLGSAEIAGGPGSIPATPGSAALTLADVPGAQFTDDLGRILRRNSHGKLQEWRRCNGKGGAVFSRWVFCIDPDSPPKNPQTIARQRRKEREILEGPQPIGQARKGKGVVPFAITAEERIRVKLRDRQRGLVKDGSAPTQLPTLPGVHALDFATRYIDGGRAKFVEMVQLAMLEGKPNATRWHAVFADLQMYEREMCSLDDICAGAGVQPSKLMAEVVSTVMEIGRDAGNLVAAMSHPAVVQKAVESALRIDGDYAEVAYKDRQALFQHHQFTPGPKGTTVRVSATAQAAAAATDPSVPKFGNDLKPVGNGYTPAALPAGEDQSLPSFMRGQSAAAVETEDED